MGVNFVFYILYFVLNILYLMRTCHTWTYFFLHLLLVNQSTYHLQKKIDCWKESTAGKTHVKQLHFYPIISYQIQKLSIQQHNVLAFLKFFFDKNLSHLNTWKGFCLSFHLSITLLHEGFHSWEPNPLSQGWFIIISFIVFTTEEFFAVAIEGWPD